MFDHVKDKVLRTVLERGVTWKALLDWALDQTHESVMADADDPDVPDSVWLTRSEHYQSALNWYAVGDEEKTLKYLRKVWEV